MAGIPRLVTAVSQLLLTCIFLTRAVATFTLPDRCPVFFKSHSQRECDPITPASFLPASVRSASKIRSKYVVDNIVFADFLGALNVTQSEFFAPWLGTWPDAIDWTAAVVGTHISGAARSISEDLVFLDSDKDSAADWRRISNLVDKYFAQIIAYYFGQDALTIRNEAYDDILWVVLGWLEAVQFVNTHSDLHYTPAGLDRSEATLGITDGILGGYTRTPDQPYHGTIWIPAFSHRARIFWNLASHGWDTKLCNGGMVWNPRLQPYKNAITNELFIAASISMYFHFPGDNNESPFSNRSDKFNPNDPDAKVPSEARDARYLKAAIEGYRWLRNSNMTNDHGLIVDGFHISGYLDENSNNTSCDVRDEMVFSYNQGVILTGQRGLFDATGASSYLTDGHRLIQNVIKATGYSLRLDNPVDDSLKIRPGALPRWHGLGRLGVMEEYCDASGTCSQDGATFKGIFFHHLTAFCAPLETPALRVHERAFASVKKSHAEACRAYSGWLEHNMLAALETRDAAGRFGQWWTAGLLAADWVGPWPTLENDGVHGEGQGHENATDYRNYGVPSDTTWRSAPLHEATPPPTLKSDTDMNADGGAGEMHPLLSYAGPANQVPLGGADRHRHATRKDPNARGRGRTVESQSGGLGLLRAYWKIARMA
ncbi:glycosyl hydrolase family 76-domain-containing protein [Xylaria grammica]|nr:glycosyl hydrolase family 76-domain-containing protein [Xylaria grammica]